MYKIQYKQEYITIFDDGVCKEAKVKITFRSSFLEDLFDYFFEKIYMKNSIQFSLKKNVIAF